MADEDEWKSLIDENGHLGNWGHKKCHEIRASIKPQIIEVIPPPRREEDEFAREARAKFAQLRKLRAVAELTKMKNSERRQLRALME